MRLIDADKEIKKLEKKIKEAEEEIKWIRLDENELNQSEKINYIQDNIHSIYDYKYVIKLLNAFETAYDLDDLMDGLNEILKDEISQPVADCVYECVQQGYWQTDKNDI